MSDRKTIRSVLEMLTQGGDAPVKESLKANAAENFKAARPWTMGKGIQGLGISEKVTDGEQLDQLVLKVYVEKKLPKSQIDNLVPPQVELPDLPPISTDVEAIGKVEKEENTTRVRPAIPGFGVGHLKVSVGTFGCLVRRKGKQTPLFMLSNSHVLANEGDAAKGDVIIQPGDYDDGKSPADDIGKLEDWVPFDFSATGYPNLVDAAIAKVRKKDVTSAIRLIGVPKGASSYLRRGMQVQKTGRTTNYTVGVIRDIDYRLALTYKKRGGGNGRVGLRDQVLCTRYTAGGDSGSAVCNMSEKVVGLHFAGSASSSIFNKIDNVLTALGIEIVTDKI